MVEDIKTPAGPEAPIFRRIEDNRSREGGKRAIFSTNGSTKSEKVAATKGKKDRQSARSTEDTKTLRDSRKDGEVRGKEITTLQVRPGSRNGNVYETGFRDDDKRTNECTQVERRHRKKKKVPSWPHKSGGKTSQVKRVGRVSRMPGLF